MLNVNISNLYQIGILNPHKGINKEMLNNYQNLFDQYKQRLHSREQGFADLPYDNDNVQEIIKFNQSLPSTITDILVVGIGGSILGPQLLLSALKPTESSPKKVHFLDNIDPSLVRETLLSINPRQTLVLIQSKSGMTPETIAHFLHIKSYFEKFSLTISDHFVFVTDSQKGFLQQTAQEENIRTFSIPSNVGGRFSILSSIGLLVASLGGIDIISLLDGAKAIVEQDKQAIEATSPYILAASTFLLNQKGFNQQVIMPYSSKLKKFSEWSVQLIAESLGKQFDLNGNIVNQGITPISAVGASDQHSQLQLFQEGPYDKLITFIEVLDFGEELMIVNNTSDLQKYPQFSYFNNLSFNQLLQTELQATRQSLTEAKRPNVTITIDQVDSYHIGSLCMFYQYFVSYLGELLFIDTFNQPGVERSKILAREFLTC